MGSITWKRPQASVTDPLEVVGRDGSKKIARHNDTYIAYI